MLKIFTLLNLAGLFLFDLFFLSDISVTQDAPTTLSPGSEVKVTVTVNKDQISGFAKLQIDLPPGLTASAIETKGASFTFAEGKAKFIWMALPSQPSFKVSYTLSASVDATGSMPITGKFSYIEDNERKTKDLPSTTVTITGGITAQDAVSPTQPSADANDLASAADSAPVTMPATMPTGPVAPQQGAGNVSATRTVTTISATEVLVEVTINKGALRGFGKLQETIPAGFTAMGKTNEEAIFTAQDRIAKFVWLNLPAKNELKVSYQLNANAQPEGEYTVNGEFGYLLNDETQKAVVGSTPFRTGVSAMAANTDDEDRARFLNELNALMNQYDMLHPEDPGSDGELKANKAQVNDLMADVRDKKVDLTTARRKADDLTRAKDALAAAIKQRKASAQQPAVAQQQPTKPVTRIPTPETGVTYKVQISAAHREVGSPYFAERHHYTGEFSIERHEGWIKYVTGRYNDYRAARDQRQSYIAANYNFPGPFVTAYNNGERITVQEALMIGNQRSAQ